MTLLNEANAIYYGGLKADAVYAGAVQVWPASGDYGPNLVAQFFPEGDRTNSDVSLGCSFILTKDVTFNKVGYYCFDGSNTGTYLVEVYDDANIGLGTPTISQAVDLSTGVPGQFSYASIPLVTLFAGKRYHLGSVPIGQHWSDDGNVTLSDYVDPASIMSFYGGTDWSWIALNRSGRMYIGFDLVQGPPAPLPPTSAEALAYLARTTGGDEGGNAANIITLIDGLVKDGVWAKLDALYILAQQNEPDALLNLLGTAYTLTKTGGTFTQYRGFDGFQNLAKPVRDTGLYLGTGFDPTTAPSPHFTQNSASFGFWTNDTLGGEIVPCFGNDASGSAGESQIYNAYNNADFYCRVNEPNASAVPTPGTSGLFVADRPSSGTVVPYWNGTAQGSVPTGSQPPLNREFKIGDVAFYGTSQQIAAAFIGASLGDTLQRALYNRISTYLNAVSTHGL